MPRIRLTKSAIDALPTPSIRRRLLGRRLSRLRREGHAEGPQGVHRALPHGRCRLEAAQIHHRALRARNPSSGTRGGAEGVRSEARRARSGGGEAGEPSDGWWQIASRICWRAFIAQRLSQNRSGGEIARLLRREVGKPWTGRSIHEISKRDVVEVISAIEQRGAPVAANKTLKSIKTFLRWCVGRAVLDQSPAEGVPLPAKEVARDRVLNDRELAQVILAARKIGGPYGGIVELLALTGQRREEVARLTLGGAGSCAADLDDPQITDKECQGARRAPLRAIAGRAETRRPARDRSSFRCWEPSPSKNSVRAKRLLDQLSGVTGWRLHDLRRTCVSGMARLGVAPHVADKILNHQAGTISGVAAVYQTARVPRGTSNKRWTFGERT